MSHHPVTHLGSDPLQETFGKPSNQLHVRPIKRALQGYPETGQLWEIHINKILQSPELAFKTTTYDWTIYYNANFEGKQVYLLQQVDKFVLACTNQELADRIYDTIRHKLQLPNEDKPPFAKMGLINNFNEIDVSQSDLYFLRYLHQSTCYNPWVERR